MARLKTFLKYILWVILFFIFSQIMIYIALNTTYKNKSIDIKTPLITSAEVRATSIDGIAKIKVNNGAANKYIEIKCFSKNDVEMGTKYINIDNIETNDEQEFEVRFNYSKVDRAELNIINEIPNEASEEQKSSDQKMNLAMTIVALILLIYFG